MAVMKKIIAALDSIKKSVLAHRSSGLFFPDDAKHDPVKFSAGDCNPDTIILLFNMHRPPVTAKEIRESIAARFDWTGKCRHAMFFEFLPWPTTESRLRDNLADVKLFIPALRDRLALFPRARVVALGDVMTKIAAAAGADRKGGIQTAPCMCELHCMRPAPDESHAAYKRRWCVTKAAFDDVIPCPLVPKVVIENHFLNVKKAKVEHEARRQ